MKYIALCLICFMSINLWADSESEKSEQFGEKKAISKVRNEGEEFKLSKESFQTLGIILREIKSSGESNKITIPKESLVKYMNIRGIYINREGWFKFLKLKVLSNKGPEYEVLVHGVKNGDKIVVKNVGLVRVAHIHASGGLGDVDLD